MRTIHIPEPEGNLQEFGMMLRVSNCEKAKKLWRLEPPFPRGCMDNVVKSVDKWISQKLEKPANSWYSWRTIRDSNPEPTD